MTTPPSTERTKTFLSEVMNVTISDAGMALVQQFEGLRLTAYRDVVGILTVGYGHTGKDVKPGEEISQTQARALLISDLQAAVAVVNHVVKVPLTQNQFDALVDFAYNAGIGALTRSTLLLKLNAGDYAGAAALFAEWDHAAGKVVPGLLRRREAEAALFLKAA